MNIEKIICASTGAVKARQGEKIQSLWSGYGSIIRYYPEYNDTLADAGLPGGTDRPARVIVKHV
ncbi:MAG: hypothetical protein PQJ50_10255, partial [Spirochaetales bacterium]|nr:hypothetical protein [Spirochaetales bacterium]